MSQHNFYLSIRIIILLRQSFFKSFILEKIPFMLLKNKTNRYKVLFNIMKKINLLKKKKGNFLLFFIAQQIFSFILSVDLFGGIHIKFFFLNSLLQSNYIIYVCLNETTTNLAKRFIK